MSTSTTEPALPPLRERMKNARAAAQRVITRSLRGGKVAVSADETEKRLSICQQCEFFRTSDGTCSQCGCFIRLKAKLATEACPLEKWEAQEPITEPEEPVVLDGGSVLSAELELREVLPPDVELVQLLNQYHRDEQRGGCRSCRKKRYVRAVQAALIDFLNGASTQQKQAVRDVFPNTTHVSAGAKAVAWSLFGVSG
jgi:hypothetical protein